MADGAVCEYWLNASIETYRIHKPVSMRQEVTGGDSAGAWNAAWIGQLPSSWIGFGLGF